MLNTHAIGTVMTNRQFYPSTLKRKKKDMACGDIDYLCNDNMSAIVWKDRNPINFLSTYHNPDEVTTTNRRNIDGTDIEISIPQLVVDYNTLMGGCNKNDQMTRPLATLSFCKKICLGTLP